MSKNYITIDNVSALLEDEEASLIYPLMDEKFINDNKLEYDDFVASENKSIFEKIFTTYMKIENGRLYDKLMEMMISHGVWDVSKKDKFKRNCIDYMNTITKDYGQEKFMGFYIKYLSAMNETGSENLIDAKGFVNSLLDIESIKPILFISAWTHIFKFYDSNTKLIENKIFSQSLKEIDFSYKMSEILKDKLSHAFFWI